jgi:hypothetical protein
LSGFLAKLPLLQRSYAYNFDSLELFLRGVHAGSSSSIETNLNLFKVPTANLKYAVTYLSAVDQKSHPVGIQC